MGRGRRKKERKREISKSDYGYVCPQSLFPKDNPRGGNRATGKEHRKGKTRKAKNLKKGVVKQAVKA